MKIRMNKKIAIILATLILTLSIGSVAFAASGYKDLKAWYNNIKIYKNGQLAQLDFEPFIIDGYTYVPLRAVGELFNKEFDWDGVNYTINIKDKPDPGLTNMMVEIVKLQQEKVTLENKVKALESELAKKPTVSSLSDLEKQLNKDYGTYEKVYFDIDLYESNKKSIEVRMYVDLDDDYDYWKKLSESKITSLIQDIVDDIKSEYKDYDVTGFIQDEADRVKLYTFTLNNRGKVVLSKKAGGGYYGDLDDLEDYLNEEYGYYQKIDFEFELYEGKDYIDVSVYVDEDDWDDAGTTWQRSFAKKIANVVAEEYPDYTIYVEVYDNNGDPLNDYEY